MPLGNPIRKQNESRIVSVLATEGQTVFTVQGGYIINQISVFRNGVRLSNSEDFTAGDGSTVTLNNAANIDDRIEFHIFDRFTVQNAIVSAASTQTISGDVVVNGKIFGNLDVPQINVASGIVTTHDLNVTGVSTIANIQIGVANDNEINTSTGQLTLDSALGETVVDDRLKVTGISTFNGIVKCVSNLDVDGTTDFGAQVIISSGNLQLNSGNIVMATAGNIVLGDSGGASDDRIVFGAGSDLSIYHDGTSKIENATGDLNILSSNNVKISHQSSGEDYAIFNENDAVELFFNNTARLKTYNGGIDVFSNINATGISSCSGNSNVGGEPPWAQASSNSRSLSISGNTINGTGLLKLGNGAATTNADFDLARIQFYNGATEVARITGETGDSNNDTGQIMFDTKVNGGSLTERLIISPAGHLLPSTDSAYDIGTSSVRFRNFYADTLYGDGSNLTGISGVSVQNQGDNRIITNTGTTDTLNAESALTFLVSSNDPILTISDSGNPQLRLRTTGTTDSSTIDFGDGDAVNQGRIAYQHAQDAMLFYVNGTSSGERIKIFSNGRVNVSHQQTIDSGTFVHIQAPSSVSSGETMVKIEGDNAAAGARLSLKNNTSGTSGYNELIGEDAGGQSTSIIRMYNTDQGNNYGEMAFATRDQSGAPPEDRVRISKDGNVAIYGNSATGGNYSGGGASPALYVSSSSGRQVKIHNTAAATCSLQLTNSTSGQGEDHGLQFALLAGGGGYMKNHVNNANVLDMYSQVSGSGKYIMKIYNDGKIGQQSNSDCLMLSTSQNGSGNQYFLRGSKNSTTPGGGNDVVWIYEDGDIYNNNNTYGQQSDIKLKENIVDANSQWNDIKNLKVRNFNFKSSTGFDTHTQIGLVAQEAELVSPGLIKVVKDRVKTEEKNELDSITYNESFSETETTKYVKYSVLHMKAIKCLQEAQARIETLEAKVAALEGS